MEGNQKILDVNHLKITFVSNEKASTAVQDLSFDLYAGEILGIVGESGSGKSVSVLSLVKLLPSNKSNIKGQIIFKGQEISSLSENEIREFRGKKIAIIFQEPMSSLNPTMKLGLQVAEVLALHTELSKLEIKEKVISLFEKVKLPDPIRIFNAYPHQASGGQLQRVMIAMAISADPDVLIADEPTTALDVTVQKEIINLLREIQKEYNTATIFISHDLNLVRQLCDRVMVMHKGNVVESGSVEEIFTNPTEPYTKGLIACRPQENFHLNRLPTVQDFLNNSVAIDPKLLREIDNTEILKIKNLKKYFPSEKNWFGKVIDYTKAVDDVSFQIRKGEILGLVGESGCGKSTLGKLVSKLISPDEGKIYFENQDVSKIQDDELRAYRKKVQMIFQDPYGSLNPRMKIGEAIIEPILSHRMMSKKQAEIRMFDLLAQTGLAKEHANRYPHQFSGGQRQRISIARALSLEPRLLVCDESISALDVSIQAQVINLLLDLRDKLSLSILFIAHDLAAVRFISDQVAVMHNGKIVEIAKPEMIYNNPQNEYTKKLLSAVQ